jgi:hypothetical protein
MAPGSEESGSRRSAPNRAHVGTQVAVDRAAVSLLARVLAYRPSQGPPIIQIAACCLAERPALVATSLAQTCAVLVGRTLLLEIDQQQAGLFVPPDSSGPLPDAFLTGLYHYRIGGAVADAELLYGAMRTQALAALASPFRFLVVAAPGPAHGATLALAPLCSGTVLVVNAGVTAIAAINGAAASIHQAGGRVIGTVLAGVARKRVMVNINQ